MHLENRDRLIAYSLLSFLTPNRSRLLREHFDPLEQVSSAPPPLLEVLLSVTPEQALVVKNPLTIVPPGEIARLRNSTITLLDPDYPPLLREIVDPPFALHFRGDPALVGSPCVAVVGSRRASPYGINAARSLSHQLADAGLTIVSGMALGVDTAAHQATIEAGGRTIAVLGTGIDQT